MTQTKLPQTDIAPELISALRDIALLKGRLFWKGTDGEYIHALSVVALDALAKLDSGA